MTIEKNVFEFPIAEEIEAFNNDNNMVISQLIKSLDGKNLFKLNWLAGFKGETRYKVHGNQSD